MFQAIENIIERLSESAVLFGIFGTYFLQVIKGFK